MHFGEVKTAAIVGLGAKMNFAPKSILRMRVVKTVGEDIWMFKQCLLIFFILINCSKNFPTYIIMHESKHPPILVTLLNTCNSNLLFNAGRDSASNCKISLICMGTRQKTQINNVYTQTECWRETKLNCQSLKMHRS